MIVDANLYDRTLRAVRAFRAWGWGLTGAAFAFMRPVSAQPAPAGPPSVDGVLDRLKSAGGFEFTLPGADPEPIPGPEPRPNPGPISPPDERFDTPDEPFEFPEMPSLLPDTIPEELRLLFWLLIFAALLYAFMPILSEFTWRVRGRPGRPTPARATKADDADVDVQISTENAMAKAERLAAGGAYADAVRCLWLGALFELDSHALWRGKASDTGRDVLHALAEGPAPEGLVNTLSHLSRSVEISLFGGRSLDNDDYEEGLAAFRTLRASIQNGGVGSAKGRVT